MNNIEDIIQITEFGAAEAVPGSKLMLESGKNRILVDIGTEYKKDEENMPLPFDARSINQLLLTHGNADHMGQLLKLTKAGFKGKIFSTQETADITETQLSQSVSSSFIHNNWAKGRVYNHDPKKGEKVRFKEIMFTYRDMKEAMNLFEPFEGKRGFPYEQQVNISGDVKATFYEAGHIPGAAQILFEISKNGRQLKLLTSYDLGRTDYKITQHPIANIPLVRFPHTKFPKGIDYIVVESTYGNKVHGNLEDSIGSLEGAAKDAAKNGGKLIIPAFSIMRTQMIWDFFFRLGKEGRLPLNMPLYSSSPTADEISRIMLKYIDNFDEEAKKEFVDKDNNPFHFDRLIRHRKMGETIELLKDKSKASYSVIASSGMCDFGRIVTILGYTISDPKNIILSTGYAAEGTRMWMMQNHYEEIPFNETIGPVKLRADVRKMGGLSGHADCKEIIAHLRNIHDPARGEQFKGIYIKHGEKDACHALREEIIKEGYNTSSVYVMKKGEAYRL